MIRLVMTMTLLSLVTWKPQYAQLPKEVQDWYQAQELTPEGQIVFQFKSCCANSDVVSTQFRVDKTTGADQWWFLNSAGKWERIPDYAIHWGSIAPGGKAVMFALNGRPTCFYPAASGN